MRAIMVMYDSLNRHYLPNYGDDITKMPNFVRLGKHTVTFDNAYAGSMPCMPARRELHTGRLNFLHRGWCPLEPFDDSLPEILKRNGIHTHLVSDHQHYWEDGGATYHTRYSSWECARGQEGDPWKCDLGADVPMDRAGIGPAPANPFGKKMHRQDFINRSYLKEEKDFPQAVTFQNGLDFIEKNNGCDNWFLQIETFDPHEPFFSPEEYQILYGESSDAQYAWDWPPYGAAVEPEETVERVRTKYRALLSMCDHYLGKVLDAFDRYDMWKDTMLIVNTDHGYMLGEHLWWSKGVMPLYNEMARIPLFIWDPRCGIKGERRNSLVQTIDLAPTLLEYFDLPIPQDMQGCPLRKVVSEDKKIRDFALFGFFGSMINITDGRYIYMKAPAFKENQPLTEYTLMPNMMRARIPVDRLERAVLHPPFSFTKGCPVLAVPASEDWGNTAACYRYGDVLYDLETDPNENSPLGDPQKAAWMQKAMRSLMRENDAPPEQYSRMGIPIEGDITADDILRQQEEREKYDPAAGFAEYNWEETAKWAYVALVSVASPFVGKKELNEGFQKFLEARKPPRISMLEINAFLKETIPQEYQE